MALTVTRYLPTRLAATRPRHGLTCVSFIAGVGMQINSSDPVVMHRMGDGGQAPGFAITLDAFRVRLAAGDERARARIGTDLLGLRVSRWSRTASSCQTMVRLRSVREFLYASYRTMYPASGLGVALFRGSGGRQLDGAVGSLGALEKVTASSRVRRVQEQGRFYRPLRLRHPHRAWHHQGAVGTQCVLDSSVSRWFTCGFFGLEANVRWHLFGRSGVPHHV